MRTDLEYTLEEADADGVTVIEYDAEEAPTGAERLVAIKVAAGDQAMVVIVGWSGGGPFANVYGFADAEQITVDVTQLSGIAMVRLP